MGHLVVMWPLFKPWLPFGSTGISGVPVEFTNISFFSKDSIPVCESGSFGLSNHIWLPHGFLEEVTSIKVEYLIQTWPSNVDLSSWNLNFRDRPSILYVTGTMIGKPEI